MENRIKINIQFFFLYIVSKKCNIWLITLKYLTVGYTQNEGDSVDAKIEDEAKKILRGGIIYEPPQWISVTKCAKQDWKPIHCVWSKKELFFYLKILSLDIGIYFKINEIISLIIGENVLWNSIKMIRIERENPFLLKYKTTYTDDNFNIIDTKKKCRKSFNDLDLKLCTLNNITAITEA